MLRNLIFAFLLCQLCAQGVNSQDIPVKPNSTTTEKPTTTPPTTTEKPTTTPAPPTPPPTTEKPTTPAPPAPTTTPKPVPAFPANVGNWSYTDADKNVTCIVFIGALQLAVTPVNKTEVRIDVPVDAKATGSCNGTSQYITLTWNVRDAPTQQNKLTFFFELNKTAPAGSGVGGPISPKNYALTDVEGFTYYMNNRTLENVTFSMDKVYAYQTTQNNSYRCMSEEVLTSKIVKLKLEHLQMQAFRKTLDSKFGTATTCTLDGYVADIVPIAVGASLAGLVAIVLVAYLIGRRRSRARGYQSV